MDWRKSVMGNGLKELYWLGYLLTGNIAMSIEAVVDTLEVDGETESFFTQWLVQWSRKVFLSKVLAGVRTEMKASVLRTQAVDSAKLPAIPAGWSLDAGTGKAELEKALLGIDIFPRCGLILTMFEKLSLEDAAVLLDADEVWVATARTLGLLELVNRLALRPAGELAA